MSPRKTTTQAPKVTLKAPLAPPMELDEDDFNEDEAEDEDETGDTDDDAPQMTFSEPESPLDQALKFDLFDHCERQVAQKGDGVIYHIYRDNALLTTHPHPYSWAHLQRDHGGGNYRVQAKSLTTGFFIKQQRKMIHDPPIMNTATEESTREDDPAPRPQGPGGPSFLDAVMLMEKMQEKREQASRGSMDKLVAALTAIVPVALPLLLGRKDAKQVDPSVTLMLEFMRESSRETKDSVANLIRMIQEKKEDKGPNPFELLDMAQKAEDRGYTKHREMLSVAQDMAEERAARMIEMQPEKKEESLTDKLLSGFLPVVTEALKAANQQPVARQPQPALERAPAPHPEAVRAEVIARTQARMAQPQSAVASKPNVVAPTISTTKGNGQMPGPKTDMIEAILTPIIAESLKNMAPPESAGKAAVLALAQQGISVQLTLKDFTRDDMANIIIKHKLPSAVNPWFNKLYAYFEAQARMVNATGNADRGDRAALGNPGQH